MKLFFCNQLETIHSCDRQTDGLVQSNIDKNGVCTYEQSKQANLRLSKLPLRRKIPHGWRRFLWWLIIKIIKTHSPSFIPTVDIMCNWKCPECSNHQQLARPLCV